MRRTLITLAAFLVCASGVALGTAEGMPDPSSATDRAAAREALHAPERGTEPVARALSTPVPAAVSPQPAPVEVAP